MKEINNYIKRKLEQLAKNNELINYSYNLIEILKDNLFMDIDDLYLYQNLFGIVQYTKNQNWIQENVLNHYMHNKQDKRFEKFNVYSKLVKEKYNLPETCYQNITWECLRIHSNLYFCDKWKNECEIYNNNFTMYNYIELLNFDGRINLDINKNIILLSYYAIVTWGNYFNDFVGEKYYSLQQIYKNIKEKEEIKNLVFI